MKPLFKVAVTGAAGQIGYALLFRIASGQVFGPNALVDLHLLEITPALPALRGVAMELEDCAFPCLNRIVMTDDPVMAMRDVNWAVLVGAAPRRQGMERADLLKQNASIFTVQGQALNAAAEDLRVLVVGNPCNTNCLIAMHHAKDVPSDRFFAMTRLDENRAKALLANKAGCSVSDVSHMAIWGNHSSTQYPDFYHARIGGALVSEVINDEAWLKNDFIEGVQQRGAAIIKARGASSAASAANAIIDSLHALYANTQNDDYYSVACCSQGEYGVDPGLVSSFPMRTEAGRHTIVTDISHDSEFAQEKMRVTVEELCQERDAVKELGFI